MEILIALTNSSCQTSFHFQLFVYLFIYLFIYHRFIYYWCNFDIDPIEGRLLKNWFKIFVWSRKKLYQGTLNCFFLYVWQIKQ